MRITVVGKGNVGGGLADLWQRAGHDVRRIGRDGGQLDDAEVVVLAVPGNAVVDAFERITGYEGRTFIDATNLIGTRPPADFSSNAEYVKARTGGPTAKSFNINFASLYGRLPAARARPGNLWCGEEEARAAVEQLSRDAGYEPICAGGLDNAPMQEAFIGLVFAISQAGLGQFVYRMAAPEDL